MTNPAPVSAALVRSSLHLSLLRENDPSVDHVIYRDERLHETVDAFFPGKGLFVDREQRPAKSPLGALRTIAHNRAYYRKVRATLEPLGIERLILFLEGEPLERSILDWHRGSVELWEDGLSHYVDLTTPLWYAARGFAQILSGFYPKGAMRRRADRTRMLVRDRFAEKNLHLPLPVLAPTADQVLFIGSPMVEDRLLSAADWHKGLETLASLSPWPIRYLPHPREDRADLGARLARLPGVTLADLPHGIAPHAQAHGYRAFIAPVSTALLDLGAFDQSLFTPILFGQKRIGAVLADWRHNPVAVAASPAEVAAFFTRLAAA